MSHFIIFYFFYYYFFILFLHFLIVNRKLEEWMIQIPAQHLDVMGYVENMFFQCYLKMNKCKDATKSVSLKRHGISLFFK